MPTPDDSTTSSHGKTTALAGRALLVTLLVLAADQALKTLVRSTIDRCNVNTLADCDRVDLWVTDVVYVRNTGSIFGFAQGLWVWLLVAVLGTLLILVYAYVLRGSGWRGALAVGLQAGGALGNLVDRVLVGGGIDYLVIDPLSLVINLADVALLAGMLLAMVAILQVLAAQESPFAHK